MLKKFFNMSIEDQLCFWRFIAIISLIALFQLGITNYIARKQLEAQAEVVKVAVK